jgi:hemerythrin-like domain-containing protein
MNMTTKQPIKRNESIVKLSREHHFSLLFGWKIRQGLKNNTAPERIQRYAEYFRERHILPHFREEEEILFIPSSDPLVQRAKKEHTQIRGHLEDLSHSKETGVRQQLQLLVDELDQHIRFEERELFPHLEKILKPEQLELIGKQLKEASGPENEDRFEDAFWNLQSSL